MVYDLWQLLDNNKTDLLITTEIEHSLKNADKLTTVIGSDEVVLFTGFVKKKHEGVLQMLSSFDWQVFLGIATSVFVLSLCTVFFDWVYNKILTTLVNLKCRFRQHLFNYFATALEESFEPPPDRQASRFVASFWWLGLIVFWHAIVIHLKIHFLYVPHEKKKLMSFNDLVSSQKLQVKARKDTLYEDLLQKTKLDLLSITWGRLKPLPASHAGHINRNALRICMEKFDHGITAYFDGRLAALQWISEHCSQHSHVNLYMTKQPVTTISVYLVASHIVSPSVVAEIQRRIRSFREGFLYEAWSRAESSQSRVSMVRKKKKYRYITANVARELFAMLLLGLFIAAIVATLEWYYFHKAAILQEDVRPRRVRRRRRIPPIEPGVENYVKMRRRRRVHVVMTVDYADEDIERCNQAPAM